SANPAPLIFFIVILLLVLIGMATFRSPAVALMPDVTIKPLRSKANAIINLMGAVGGILVLGLGMLFKTSDIKNQVMSYTWYVIAVCVIMLVSLAIFVFTVKEKKWNKEMLLSQQEFDEANPDPVEDNVIINAKGEEKLPKDKLKSLIFILASVAFWFIGYNAITSKYSLYAINILQKDFNVTLLVAQAAAIISYIPIGFIASKLGRKKCILIGIGLLTTAFGGAIFVNSATPDIVIYLLFALAGIAWATINVNSFPMVVELSQGGNIGKYTGYYYTASMAAQVLTPILSGFLMDTMGSMSILFPYGATFVALSFVTMLFVKHGDSKPIKKNNLEALSGPED
ncbi:MAG: MFS transporter, partial [Clostridia bacterium]